MDKFLSNAEVRKHYHKSLLIFLVMSLISEQKYPIDMNSEWYLGLQQIQRHI